MSRKKVFSSNEKYDDLINDDKNKFELLNCQLHVQKCKEHLMIINKSYFNAINYQMEKDYLNSIESLKNAFHKAAELQETPCSRCAALFRLTITQSLEDMSEELHKMTTGFLRKKHYQLSYNVSCKVLNDFKKND